MSVYDKAINSILTSLKSYVDKRLRKAPYDITTQGIITEVFDNNQYSVKIQGAVSTVPCVTGQTFAVGDKVLVLAVQGNHNSKYIIGGWS